MRPIPEDSRNLYFVGVADSAKLEDAKTTSKDNAIRNAASFLAARLSAKGGQLDMDKLTLSLAQASEDASNYVSFDQKNGTYTHYSLIQLNKSVAEARINLFAVQHGTTAPAGLIKALRDPPTIQDLPGDRSKHKSIFVFLDGTENGPESGTNVWRLYDLIRKNNDPQTAAAYFSRLLKN